MSADEAREPGDPQARQPNAGPASRSSPPPAVGPSAQPAPRRSTSGATGAFSGTTAWARTLGTPLQRFLGTEAGSAAVLLAGAVIALVWANVAPESYHAVWNAALSVRLEDWSITLDLRGWVNSGLMTFFFFVVGLEARREFDLGDLRERSRFALPLAAGLGGMLVPALIYVAINAGGASAHAWGVAMSTDTAFALGMLALFGRAVPDAVRAFLLTALVVDDVVALVVIATVYSSDVALRPLLMALAFFAVVLAMRRIGVRYGLAYFVCGLAIWVCLLFSGIDPIVVGLAMGLLTYAYNPPGDALDRAAELFRRFREQPTPQLARSAESGLAASLSANERLQQIYLPWTSFVIVPLFAVANAGISLDASFLSRAVHSPVTLGVIAGYVLGKPLGFTGATWLVTRLSGGRVLPPVGWASVFGGGTIAGIGFTVSLLIASRSLAGDHLEEATFGVLAAAALAAGATWGVFRLAARLPVARRLPALLGYAEPLLDLTQPVDPRNDHIRGPARSPVTVVEYGDFECPYCGRAEPVVRELLADQGDVRYVWRHLPLQQVHPHAALAAESTEAAGAQGAFWPMHDLLLTRQDHLTGKELVGYAEDLGLDVDRFREDLREHRFAARVAEDVQSAELSGVAGTPTFFINGRRHYGAYDIATLTAAVDAARARAAVTDPDQGRGSGRRASRTT
ncbi:MAG TPA: Na+/H+ antiporter NhaA [Kineosporiaceae bacterium]|nr:Na+/H+ antiporter NhaA [Kineosporiaceae bacterium]